MAAAGIPERSFGEPAQAVRALYRALAFDTRLLPCPANAQVALRAVGDALLASGVFVAVEVFEPVGGAVAFVRRHPAARGGTARALPRWLGEGAARCWRERAPQVMPGGARRRARVLVPVSRGGAASLLLVLACADPAPLPAEALSLIARMAELLGHALDEVELKGGLMQQCALQGYAARHDPQTGLPNGLALCERIAREARLCAQDDAWFAMGLLRCVGTDARTPCDEQTRASLARALRATCRHRDVVACLDDGVFGLLLRDLDARAPESAAAAMLQHWGQRLLASQHAPSTGIRLRLGMVVAQASGTACAPLLQRARAALDAAQRDAAADAGWHVVWV